MKEIVVLTLLVFSIPAGLQSQCCSGGVPISSNLGMSSQSAGVLQIQATYDHNVLADLLSEGTTLADKSRLRVTSSFLLEGNYDWSNRLATTLLVTFIQQKRTITRFDGSLDETLNQGLGDAVLLFRYNLIPLDEISGHSLSIGIGPRLPLGRIDFLDNQGILLPPDLQPGSGSWDLSSWLMYSRGGFWSPASTMTTLVTWQHTGRSQRNQGRQEYRFGREFQAQVSFSDRVVLGKWFVDPMFQIRWRSVGQDFSRAVGFGDLAPVPNSGGHYLFLVPGLNINSPNNLSLRLMGHLPIFRYMSGTQVATSYRLSVSLHYALSLRSTSPTFTNPSS